MTLNVCIIKSQKDH